MPEGHTVHRVARLFRSVFVGHTIQASSPQGRFADGAALIDRQVVDDAWAVGKQFFAAIGGDWVLRVHLGIYGAWTIHGVAEAESLGAPRKSLREEGLRTLQAEAFPPEPVGQVRLRLMTDTVVADLRGPTACELLTHDEAREVMDSLGPDPLVGSPTKNRERFIELMSKTSQPVGAALMNQKLVSGIGNVYRAEILFRHRLDPHQPSRQIDPEVLGEVWDDWAVLLKKGIKTGVMVTRDDLSPAGARRALRDRRLRHYVYKREGEPCLVCGNEVVLEDMLARKLYYCPHCQTAQ